MTRLPKIPVSSRAKARAKVKDDHKTTWSLLTLRGRWPLSEGLPTGQGGTATIRVGSLVAGAMAGPYSGKVEITDDSCRKRTRRRTKGNRHGAKGKGNDDHFGTAPMKMSYF